MTFQDYETYNWYLEGAQDYSIIVLDPLELPDKAEEVKFWRCSTPISEDGAALARRILCHRRGRDQDRFQITFLGKYKHVLVLICPQYSALCTCCKVATSCG